MTRTTRLALLALVLAALAARLGRLLASPEPFGTDGYYYVVQAERLLATGHLHAPDGSWVLRWLAALTVLVGDPLVGVKVGSGLLATAAVVAAAFAGARLARSANPDTDGAWAAVALAAWAAVSPTLGQLAAEFPKSLGVVPAALFLLGIVPARPRGLTLLALGAALAAMATAHRLGAAFILLGAGGATLGLLAHRAGPRITAAFLAAALLIAAAFLAVSLSLPNLLHPADLDRLDGQLGRTAGWPAPFPYLVLRPLHPFQVAELSACWLAFPAGAAAWWKRRSSRPLLGALLLPLAACLVPPWRADVLDLGYRLLLMAPALASPLLVVSAAALLPARPGDAGPPTGARPEPAPARTRLPAVLALLAALLTWPGAVAGIDVLAQPRWAELRRLIAALPRPGPDLLIAHQGLAFLYDHQTGQEAMSWAPEPGLDRRRIGRITWGIEPGEWREWAPAMQEAPVRPLGGRYAYVREDVWEAFLARALVEGDDGLQGRLDDWRNPRRVRPPSLLRNHATPLPAPAARPER